MVDLVEPKACYMRGKINVYNREPIDAVSYKLEILHALNILQNKKDVSLRETLVLTKKVRNLQMSFSAARHTVKELTL